MLKCCCKGGLVYIVRLLLFKVAQGMLAYVSAAGKVTLGNLLVEEKGRKKTGKKAVVRICHKQQAATRKVQIM